MTSETQKVTLEISSGKIEVIRREVIRRKSIGCDNLTVEKELASFIEHMYYS